MIRVVVADDHAIVREGVKALLSGERDVVVVAEAADGPAAVDAVAQHQPDVLLIDLTMDGGSGVDAISRVQRLHLKTAVLVLSMHASREYVHGALRAGAAGYVVKGSGLDHLVRGLRVVAGGGRFLDAAATRIVDAHPVDVGAGALERLTPREREVLELVARGLTNKEIAERLDVAPKTIDNHRASLMKKLDLHDAPAVTRFAMRHGLISLD